MRRTFRTSCKGVQARSAVFIGVVSVERRCGDAPVLLQAWCEDLGPQPVALVVEVQAVVTEQPGLRLAVGAEQRAEHVDELHALLLLADGGDEDVRLTLLTGRTVFIHEALTGRLLARAEADLGYGPAPAFSPDGLLLAAAGAEELFVWEAACGRCLLRVPARGRL